MTESIIKSKRCEIEALCERYGVERLALFGSAVREDFDPERSDLDFAVSFSSMSPEEHASSYFGLLRDLEELFGRPVDLVEVGAVRNPYLRREMEAGQDTLYVAT